MRQSYRKARGGGSGQMPSGCQPCRSALAKLRRLCGSFPRAFRRPLHVGKDVATLAQEYGDRGDGLLARLWRIIHESIFDAQERRSARGDSAGHAGGRRFIGLQPGLEESGAGSDSGGAHRGFLERIHRLARRHNKFWF